MSKNMMEGAFAYSKYRVSVKYTSSVTRIVIVVVVLLPVFELFCSRIRV